MDVRIHCTEVRIHCTDILMNVSRFLYVFLSVPRKLYTIFQATFSLIKRYQDIVFKLLTLSTDSDCCLCRLFIKFRLDLRHLKFCDRVCTQSKKFHEGYFGIVRLGKMLAGKWCYNFLGNNEKTWEKSLLNFA